MSECSCCGVELVDNGNKCLECKRGNHSSSCFGRKLDDEVERHWLIQNAFRIGKVFSRKGDRDGE